MKRLEIKDYPLNDFVLASTDANTRLDMFKVKTENEITYQVRLKKLGDKPSNCGLLSGNKFLYLYGDREVNVGEPFLNNIGIPVMWTEDLKRLYKANLKPIPRVVIASTSKNACKTFNLSYISLTVVRSYIKKFNNQYSK